MKKHLIALIILCFLNAVAIFARNTIEVKEALSGESMHGVTVHFKSLEGKTKDSTKIVITNKNGTALNPFSGRTFVLLTYLGYKKISDTIDASALCFNLVPESIQMNELVVTGQYKPISSQKSVFDVKVIDEARIKSQGANNLRELLVTEANMRISQDNILGSSININGISGENVKIMIDGVPVIGRLNGNIDISQINLNNVKRVEIVEGPMSSIYGSDALGGVINLITKEPECDRVEFEAESYFESAGVYNFIGLFRYSFDNLHFMLNGGRNLFKGFDPEDDSRNVKWNPKEQYFADLKAEYSFDNHEFSFSSKFFHEFILNRGDLRPPYFETAFDDKYRTSRLTNSLFYKGKIGLDKYLSVTGAYSYYSRKKNTFFKDMLTLEEKMTESPSEQDTSFFHAYMLRGVFSDDKFSSFLKYQAGIDINHDIAEGKKIESGRKEMSEIAAFASVQYLPFDFLTLQPSLRVIENSNYEAPLVPAINFKTDILDELTLRASYARGFRAPSIKELYYEFVDINHNIYGNEDLSAETSDSYNLSLSYNNQCEKSYFSLEPKVFYNKISNMITLALIEGEIYKNVNIGKYETIGTNFSIKYFLKDFTFKTDLSYIGRLNTLHDGTGTRKYNFSPEFSMNLDYTIDLIETKINIFYKYSGKMPGFTIVDEQPVEYTIGDFNMMDISLSRSFSDYIDIVAGIKNVFDVVDIKSTMSVSTGAHSSGASYPIGWGRSFFVRMKIKVN